jgi:GDPmannose 4,6-dehydratase
LGDLSIIRDWGYAEDYVNAMWLMLQHEKPQDYVVASGESRTLHDFVREALGIAGLHGDVGNWVVSDPSLFRASEITNLTGDYRRANSELGWKPTTEFPVWVKKMIDNDCMIESNVKS